MFKRTMSVVAVAVLAMASGAQAQGAAKEAMAGGKPLSAWIADLKNADAPETRNAAAYEISSMGTAAAPAVPALIEALDDPSAAVRFPVTVALGEIGPAAAPAVPRLKKMMDEEVNDELAAAARRAIRKIKPEALANQ